MIEFLRKIKARHETAELSARDKYLALARKAARSGDLSQADSDALDKAAGQLGYPLDRVEADVQLIADYHATAAAATKLPDAQAAFTEATASANAHRVGTESLMRERSAEEDRLNRAAGIALSALDVARKASLDKHRIEKDHGHVIGIDPTLKLAYLLDATEKLDSVNDRLRERRLWLEGCVSGRNRLPDGDSAQAQRDLADHARESKEEVARTVARDAAMQKAGATTFYVSDESLRNVSLDLRDFDFKPAPGQSPEAFNVLSGRLRRAVADRDAHQKQVQQDMRTGESAPLLVA
jgi:hypothetical protein